jgi:signal peptidase I
LGIAAAYLLNIGLGIILGTNLPIVAVVSDSMMHDITTEVRHYEFLESNYGYTKDQIDSWSLKNGFKKGDVLLIKGVKPDDLKIGDVIVYDIDGQTIPIVHRIVDVNENFVTKGDHNPGIDPWGIKKIRGKAIFVIPFIGWPKLILTYIISAVLR